MKLTELEKLHKQRNKLEDEIYEKGETPKRGDKWLELTLKIQELEEKKK
jgi:hypothetical protein